MASHSAAAATMAVKKFLIHSPFTLPTPSQPSHFFFLPHSRRRLSAPFIKFSSTSSAISTSMSGNNKKRKKLKQSPAINNGSRRVAETAVKRRTRSETKFDEESVLRFGDIGTHIPVMLSEILEVFGSRQLHSFVDCTLGAAGHSAAIILAHPEMQSYVGLDVDPVAHEKARDRINIVLHGNFCGSTSNLKRHTVLKNFKDIKSVLREVDENLLVSGVDGILMDLGVSSMQVNNAERGFSVLSDGPLDMRMDPQASLTAEDILNSWPDAVLGQILRDYGEESNWCTLQKRIVGARLSGGLHSTSELLDLIRSCTYGGKGGRQGWIKTATRVFQALRIAVNDELKTLETSLHSCFDCLSPGGRLAVISFHSLEDRIVKQTFLNIINSSVGNGKDSENEAERCFKDSGNINVDYDEKEVWIKQIIKGVSGTILTKRPITPSEDEEGLNWRCRSAKLRVLQRA